MLPPKTTGLAETIVNPDPRVENRAVTVQLRGEIDIASAPALEKELGRAELASPDRLVLDCRELEFIDSSGLSVLVAAHQRATREGRELVLSNTPDHARRVFDVAGLAGWFVFA